MNVKDAITEIRKLTLDMNRAAELSQIDSKRYEAHMTLYNVACSIGDPKMIEQERLTLHSALDGILDAGFTIHTHQARINEIQRTVTDD